MNRGDLLKLYNRGVLSTDVKRKGAFKKSFNYVEPVPLFLGNDENGTERFAQYVPVQETLAALFKSESVREQYAATRLQPSTVNLYQDVRDGEGVQSNLLLKSEPSSVGLVLYQDAFEVVGSGERKHKVLAVYSTLADILPHNRSTINQMQLVLLCREQDFKYFGMNNVFEPLVKDLKVLEEEENFSRANDFCRYCEVDRATFMREPHLCGTTRTAQSYQSHLQDLKTSDTNSVCGIKSDSPFNQLGHFHVCQPGLLPCLGHDLFEGIVSYDLALFISHLVKEKHFTYLQLNRCKNQFKYQGNDGKGKPADLSPGSERLSGHAVQNWCFLDCYLSWWVTGLKIHIMNRDDIKEAVLSFLPGLSVETLTSLLEGFEELGVESRADLVYVQEKDLERYLRPIQTSSSWYRICCYRFSTPHKYSISLIVKFRKHLVFTHTAWHVTAWHVMVYRLSGQMERDASSNSNCSGRSKKTITRGQKRYGEGSGGPNVRA
ncbi:hypothetical protein F7725_009726 [Dissostichus mawsoni]|uniref:Uncharacterized protein n=1 Tax=Dissostichus mawsoni TaxID=36200 RepID=A0A7J5XPG1_DISMA|nr:hypothetical protein F7725_009726 [Dissostichus mawsoni]